MIWSTIASAAGSFLAKLGLGLARMFALIRLGKEKEKRKIAEKDVEVLEKDVEILASHPDDDTIDNWLRGDSES